MKTNHGQTPAYAADWARELRAAGLVPLRDGWDVRTGAEHTAVRLGGLGAGVSIDSLEASAHKQAQGETLSEHVYTGPTLFFHRQLPAGRRSTIEVTTALTHYAAGATRPVVWAPEWFAVLAAVGHHERLPVRVVNMQVERVLCSKEPRLAEAMDAAYRLGGWRAVGDVVRSF